MLYRVLYCSQMALAADTDPDGEILRILTSSRQNNARIGVTGGLLFSRGCFAQILEGALAAVTGTFERIQRDERHCRVTVLQAEPVQARLFPDWAMSYAGIDASHDPQIGAGLADALSGERRGGQEILDMLRSVMLGEDERLRMA